MNCRLSLGWRWAFLLQLPLFAISFILTAFNLHYVTPVRPRDVLLLFFALLNLFVPESSPGEEQEREGGAEKDRLRRERYSARHGKALPFTRAYMDMSHVSRQVLSFLVFLSTRFSEEYPVRIVHVLAKQ